MTDAQRKRFYFPAWQSCAEANDWIMVGKRLLADLVEQRGHVDGKCPEPWREAFVQVLDYAEQLARQEHRAVTADDLRRGCNLAATGGRRSSSGQLNNREMTRVTVLFRLLTEPENLQAITEWLHPELADKRSLVELLLKRAPAATLIAISRNAFGTIYWEDLDGSRLRWLLRELKDRKSEQQYAAGPF
jgi:hypothetical protein